MATVIIRPSSTTSLTGWAADPILTCADDDNSTGVNLNHTADYDFLAGAAYTGNALTQTITYHKLIISVKPSISDSLSSRTNQVAINGILLPNPNLVSGNNGNLSTDDEGNDNKVPEHLQVLLVIKQSHQGHEEHDEREFKGEAENEQ